jgi:hypothetical protein
LTLDNEDIIELIKQYDKESRAIKEEALRNCWYMRGGITYDIAMELGPEERKIISEIIKENLETTKKSGLNFF